MHRSKSKPILSIILTTVILLSMLPMQIAFAEEAESMPEYLHSKPDALQDGDVLVVGVSLDHSTLSLSERATEELSATMIPPNATNRNMAWTSSNTDAAVVDSTGKVTALNAGTAAITVVAEDGNYTGISNVTITGGGMAAGKTKWVGNIWYNGNTPDYYDDYWNQVTPENATKWASCEFKQGVYNFNDAISMYNYCNSRGIPFKFHTLVWGNQYPSWLDNLSPQEQKVKVENWIKAAGQNFPNADFVDVVNEAMPGHAQPKWKDAIGGYNDYYGTGWDWVVWSFEKARQYFPNSKLLINDYNILNGFTNIDMYINVINILKSRGLIDGIGCQAHGLENTKASDVIKRLDKLAATGLPIYISEFDLNIEDDTVQKDKMQELFPAMYEHPAVKGITLWGYLQGHTWLPNSYLIRSDGSERPALTWLKQYLVSISSGVTGVTLDKSILRLSVGESVQLTATVTPSDAINKDVIWDSSNPYIAVVDDTGKVKGVSEGTAIITVTTEDGNYTAECEVIVTKEGVVFTIISDGELDRTGGILASVTVAPVQEGPTHDGAEVVLFQLMKGNTPVCIVALEKDITAEEILGAYFNVDPDDNSYKVRVYVLDSLTTDLTSAPVNLAEWITLQ
ncbi:MAG TPA: hypothetical protein GXX36_16590 [Clostridiaceae bacterium]|nr:hypothetical protein [Clostridiaceae bacterium]